MTLTQLKYIITTAEVGSINKAAESLYVAQPSMTSAIKDLESEIGITIFHRGVKGVTLTNDGVEFLQHAREIYRQYETVLERFKGVTLKKKFGISTQHYSFAVKAFVEMVKAFDTKEYEFAIRETKTKDVINDVTTLKSEIGVLYLDDYNRTSIMKLLKASDLEFHHLISCQAFVYIWNGHPLASKKTISLEDLADYPCLSFEQGDTAAFYLNEEILSTMDYPRTIKANDRATMLNLMIGLNGYTLCSGIICEELNGSDYKALPFADPSYDTNNAMEIGYIIRKKSILSNMAELYINELKKYLKQE